MTTLIWIIIGLLVIFGTLYFLYKKGMKVKDKELEEGLKVLKNTNDKKRKKIYKYRGNAYLDFKKKPSYKKTEL